MDLFTREEIEQIIVMERLHLYNRGLSYGAQAILRVLEQEGGPAITFHQYHQPHPLQKLSHTSPYRLLPRGL